MKMTSIVDSNGKPNKVNGIEIDPANYPHRVRQVGTTSILVWSDSADEALADCADKNQRAEQMGIKARYEIVGP